MELRTATTADVPAVVALWDRAGGPTRSTPDEGIAHRLLARDPDALVVAEVDGELAGTLVVGWDGWRCHLYRLAVDERFRRRGIARALLDEGLDRARRLGAVRADAMVRGGNDGAIAFWSAAGFVLDDEDSRWSLVL